MKLALLPGLDGTGELFAPFVAALAGTATRIVSYPTDRAMDYAGHEAVARAQLPQDDFVLVAESFSGPVGISIAAAPPPGLRGLVLCATFASNPFPRLGFLAPAMRVLPAPKLPRPIAARWLYPGRETPELRDALSAAMRRVSMRTLGSRIAAVLSVDHRNLVSRIAVPMLYLRADQDRVIPRAAGLHILGRRAGIALATFDAPHFLLQTEPAACAATVLDFAARCS
jgi:pimeloyl-ACP methyl ester carboxylesterase